MIRGNEPTEEKFLALGPVSRILFYALRRFGRHFSRVRLARDLACQARLREHNRLRHTRDYRTGHPVTYFALHRKGFVVPPSLLTTRWALTPPFHPYCVKLRVRVKVRGFPLSLFRFTPRLRSGIFSVTLSVAVP